MRINATHISGLNIQGGCFFPSDAVRIYESSKFEMTPRCCAPLNRCFNYPKNKMQPKSRPKMSIGDKKSGLIKALFEFCHVSRVKLSPDGRNNVRLDGGDVLVLHAKTQAESSGSGSGSALAPALELRRGKNAGIRAKQCEISEECFPWQLVEMIQGGMRSQGAAFHPQSCAGTNPQHAENILVLVLKSHHIGAYLEGTWRVWQARSCSEIWLSKILIIIIILKRAGTLSAPAFFFCFLLLRLLPGAACLKREEGRNFRN